MNITTQIRELNRLKLDEVDYSRVIEMIKPLVKKIPMLVKNSNSSQVYFRSRIVNGKDITSINDLMSPPNHLVKGFQRCNPPNKSIFYASSKRITSIMECNPKIGDIIYLSQWLNNEPVPLNMLLTRELVTNKLPLLSSEVEMIINYFDTIFTRPIHKSFSNSYKITSAISELFTNNFSNHYKSKMLKHGEIGLVYPSIYDINGSYNFAFEPKFAKLNLSLLHIMKLKITDRSKGGIVVDVLNNARALKGNSIVWTNEKNNIPLPNPNSTSIVLKWLPETNSMTIPVFDTPQNYNLIEQLLNE